LVNVLAALTPWFPDRVSWGLPLIVFWFKRLWCDLHVWCLPVDVVVASGLTKYYGGRVGVVDVSFSLRRGEVLGYLGPNGSGKTTTIRLMLGFIRPSRGSVLVYGVSPSSSELAGVKRFIGYVPEEFSFPGGLRGRDIVGYFSRMRGGAHRLRELLELFPGSRQAC